MCFFPTFVVFLDYIVIIDGEFYVTLRIYLYIFGVISGLCTCSGIWNYACRFGTTYFSAF